MKNVIRMLTMLIQLQAIEFARGQEVAAGIDQNQYIATLRVSREDLQVGDRISRLEFDFSQVDNISIIQEKSELFLSKITEFEVNAEELGPVDERNFTVKSGKLAEAIYYTRPTELRRVFKAPFIRSRVNERNINVPIYDLSLNYSVIFDSSTDRDRFIDMARNIPNVVVHAQRTNDHYENRGDIFPIKDPRFSEQWYLQPRSISNQHSLNALSMWYMSSDNNEIRIAVNEVRNPVTDDCTFWSPDDHYDLAANIVAQESESGFCFTDHSFAVVGAVSAETNNSNGTINEGIAGASYNSQIYLSVWEDPFWGAIQITNAVDFDDVHILNLSWGSGPNYDANMDAAINYAIDQGVMVVAAGPQLVSGTVYVDYPSSYRSAEIITVNGHTQTGQLHPGGNMSPLIDISAPGDNILSTTSEGLNEYAIWGGTSFAAPQVSGVVAALKNLTLLPEDEIISVLTLTAQDRGAFGYDNTFGYGVVNGFAALAYGLSKAEDENYNPEVDVVGAINTFTGDPSIIVTVHQG
jgi:hypothetical protein